MTTLTSMGRHEQEEGELLPDYRALSKAAVFSLVLSLAGFAWLLSPMFAFLPLLGLASSLIGIWQVKRHAEDLTGRVPALVACVLSAVLLVLGGAWHTYVYITEVPENAQRVAFWELLADTRPLQPPIPPSALQLDGQRIFIKGYVHPSVADTGMVSEFLLVPDMGTCCFGGQPKLTHMINVRLSNNLRLKYSYRKRALAGVFHVDPSIQDPSGTQGPCYTLEADFLN